MQSLGGGFSSGSSNNGSLSTVSKVEAGFAEQDYIGLSEVSSYSTIKQVGESGLGLKDTELELGLSLISSSGCGEKNGGKNGRAGSLQEEYCRVHMGGSGENQGTWGGWVPQERAARILTAKDFAPLVSRAVAGTKRVHTESVAGDAVQEVSSVPSSSQVVGWPPIRAYRINSLVNKTRVSAEDIIENNHNYEENNGKNKKNVQEKGGQVQGNSLFVKVNMDGIPIGRKVDLDAHVCYETLAQALEDMFQRPNTTNIRQSGAQSGMEKELGIVEAKPSKLLDGSSEFVLTYEDKEGDWMLVGDVPWGMFLSAVKRIRIMRTSEANGLGPTFQDKGNRQRSKACLA